MGASSSCEAEERQRHKRNRNRTKKPAERGTWIFIENRSANGRSAPPPARNPQNSNARRGNGAAPVDPQPECVVCGHVRHIAANCYHRFKTCHICHKKGHLASVCRAEEHHPDSRYKQQQPKPKNNPANKW